MKIITEKVKKDGKDARWIRSIIMEPSKRLIESKGTLRIKKANHHGWQIALVEGETVLETDYQKILENCRAVIKDAQQKDAWAGMAFDEL